MSVAMRNRSDQRFQSGIRKTGTPAAGECASADRVINMVQCATQQEIREILGSDWIQFDAFGSVL